MRLHVFISAIAICQLVGCASIVTGQNQSVSVETRTDTASVEGAKCKLSNDKGTWYVTSPGSTVVQRSYQDLDVRCERESHEPGIASAKSSTKGMVAGNVLFGGAIGIAVDVGTGAAYDYPALITVLMGKPTTLGLAPAMAANASIASQSQPAAAAVGPTAHDSTEMATIATPVDAAPAAPAGRSILIEPGPKTGISGLRFLLRDTDPLTRVRMSDSLVMVESISDRGTTINGGYTTLDATGQLLTGTVPLPHVAGLGGGRLSPGMVMTASLIPTASYPPVEVRMSVLGKETLFLSGREIAVVRCSISGYAPRGANLGMSGALISGDIVVEPATGLVLSANVQSRHYYYAFVRNALPATR
jgi:hypothetical protein